MTENRFGADQSRIIENGNRCYNEFFHNRTRLKRDFFKEICLFTMYGGDVAYVAINENIF